MCQLEKDRTRGTNIGNQPTQKISNQDNDNFCLLYNDIYIYIYPRHIQVYEAPIWCAWLPLMEFLSVTYYNESSCV